MMSSIWRDVAVFAAVFLAVQLVIAYFDDGHGARDVVVTTLIATVVYGVLTVLLKKRKNREE